MIGKNRDYVIFKADGERVKLLDELWPSPIHWREVLARLNEIKEGREVTSGAMRTQARLRGLRRPFPLGRYGLDIYLGRLKPKSKG